ncbi:MAG: response regulator [Acidobacteria bacterium]|nr:MAG: response regulator [Acidobacteriota bacterium]
MTEPVLIVDDDPFVLGLLTHVGETRGMDVVGVRTPEEADAAMAARPFAVVVVDLLLGETSGLDLVKRLRQRDISIETVVISADRRLSSALESFEQEVFAFLPKPLDPAHVFSTVERAMERRREGLERRRLTWELELLNKVAEIVTSSLELDAVLERAVERVGAAFDARWALVRVTPLDGGPPTVRAALGIPRDRLQAVYAEKQGPLPSDVVFDTGQPLRVAEKNSQGYASRLPPTEWTSTISVPVTAGDALLGVLTLVSQTRPAFSDADEKLLMTIGRQFGVAVSNAQLYERVHRAKVEWERTFDAISDPIAVFDGAGRTMRANAAMASIHGWRITETQGRKCDETGLCGGGANCLVRRALDSGQAQSAEIIGADRRIFAVTTLPVAGQDAAVLFAKEVTEDRQRARQLRELSAEVTQTNAELNVTVERLRATQAQLVQSEKLSAIGQLVAGVAHELNNPLTSIIGYTQLVQEAISQNPAWESSAAGMLDDINRVLSESERAARIVRNLLTFARRQSSERTRTDVSDLCKRVLALRAYDHQLRGVKIAATFAEGLPPVYVDDGQIQQALLNLVLNAEQAMKGQNAPELGLTAIAEPESSSVLVSVSDNGHGIAPENLSRVFDPFFTTRGVGEGTGLGLSIVYGIVRDHGGQVWAASGADDRTTFFVRLPARFDHEPAASRPTAIVAHADSGSRDFFLAVLSGWGYSVRSAANSREALAHVAAGECQLLLIDPAIVETDVPSWRAAWPDAAGAIAMVAIDAPHVPGEAARFLRDAASYVLAPPFDLPNIRRAVLAARGPAS